MKDLLGKILKGLLNFIKERKGIAIRFIFTILFLFVIALTALMILITVLLQYIMLFIIKRHNERLRNFSNKLSTYLYKTVRYICLNENSKPYPFSSFPIEVEESEEVVIM